MASSLRPSLVRHVVATMKAPAKRGLVVPAFRSQLLPRQHQRVSRTVSLLQTAAFQTSVRRSILPPLPQKVEGTVNDPATVPEPEPSHGSYHWTAERIVAAAMLPITVAPFAAGALNPLMDGALIGLILIHSHIGFQSAITDYFPKWRVPNVRRLLDWVLNLSLLLVGWGWYEFETNDVGLSEGVRRIWTS